MLIFNKCEKVHCLNIFHYIRDEDAKKDFLLINHIFELFKRINTKSYLFKCEVIILFLRRYLFNFLIYVVKFSMLYFLSNEFFLGLILFLAHVTVIKKWIWKVLERTLMHFSDKSDTFSTVMWAAISFFTQNKIFYEFGTFINDVIKAKKKNFIKFKFKKISSLKSHLS